MKVRTFFVKLMFFAGLIMSFDAQAKPLSIQSWTVGEIKDAKVNRIHQKKVEMMLIEQGSVKVSFIAKAYGAQSIDSIKKRMKEMKADTSTLKHFPGKDGSTVFAFHNAQQAFWFSTKGGFLELSVEPNTPVDIFGAFQAGVNRI